jgi:thioesterase domain-containing protein/acyl carrier protein
VLGVSPISVEDDFFDLGGHSLKAIRVLSEIEREFGRSLRAASLFDAPTVRTLAARLRDESPHDVTTIVAVRREGTRTPLFFAPGGGGELFVFDALARALGADQPLYVLDMYVFDEIHLDVKTITLADVAARMILDVRRIQPRGPYQLAGYSLGGNLVYEIAQQLRAAGDEVHIVVLLDCDGPGYPLMQPFLTRLLRHVTHAMALGAVDGLRYLGNRIGNMSRFFTGPHATELNLYADQEESRMVPAHVLEALEKSLGPVLAAWEQYVPRFYGGDVLLVRADVRRVMVGIVDNDPLLGWGPVVGGAISRATMPCDHFAILHSVNADRLAAILAPVLIGVNDRLAASAPLSHHDQRASGVRPYQEMM